MKTAVREPTDLSNKSPSLAITGRAALNVTGDDVAEELATTKPELPSAPAAAPRGAAAPGRPASRSPHGRCSRRRQIVAERVHASVAQTFAANHVDAAAGF